MGMPQPPRPLSGYTLCWQQLCGQCTPRPTVSKGQGWGRWAGGVRGLGREPAGAGQGHTPLAGVRQSLQGWVGMGGSKASSRARTSLGAWVPGPEPVASRAPS